MSDTTSKRLRHTPLTAALRPSRQPRVSALLATLFRFVQLSQGKASSSYLILDYHLGGGLSKLRVDILATTDIRQTRTNG